MLSKRNGSDHLFPKKERGNCQCEYFGGNAGEPDAVNDEEQREYKYSRNLEYQLLTTDVEIELISSEEPFVHVFMSEQPSKDVLPREFVLEYKGGDCQQKDASIYDAVLHLR